jgi:hypothetical protein
LSCWTRSTPGRRTITRMIIRIAKAPNPAPALSFLFSKHRRNAAVQERRELEKTSEVPLSQRSPQKPFGQHVVGCAVRSRSTVTNAYRTAAFRLAASVAGMAVIGAIRKLSRPLQPSFYLSILSGTSRRSSRRIYAQDRRFYRGSTKGGSALLLPPFPAAAIRT